MKYSSENIELQMHIALESRQHIFATQATVSPQNDVWETSAEFHTDDIHVRSG